MAAEKKAATRRTHTGISPEWEAWMEARSAGIYAATQKRGMPMTYGGGRKEPKQK